MWWSGATSYLGVSGFKCCGWQTWSVDNGMKGCKEISHCVCFRCSLLFGQGCHLLVWWLEHLGKDMVLFFSCSMVNLISGCWFCRCWRNCLAAGSNLKEIINIEEQRQRSTFSMESSWQLEQSSYIMSKSARTRVRGYPTATQLDKNTQVMRRIRRDPRVGVVWWWDMLLTWVCWDERDCVKTDKNVRLTEVNFL